MVTVVVNVMVKGLGGFSYDGVTSIERGAHTIISFWQFGVGNKYSKPHAQMPATCSASSACPCGCFELSTLPCLHLKT